MYVHPVILFHWDPAKAENNRAKDGVDLAVAQLVFEDPFHISFVSNIAEGEERWTAIGSVEGVIILVVVHTYMEQPPDEIIRLISARVATKHERNLYEQAHT